MSYGNLGAMSLKVFFAPTLPFKCRAFHTTDSGRRTATLFREMERIHGSASHRETSHGSESRWGSCDGALRFWHM